MSDAPERLLEMAGRYLDGDMAAEERARFLHMLTRDPALREAAADVADLYEQLAEPRRIWKRREAASADLGAPEGGPEA